MNGFDKFRYGSCKYRIYRYLTNRGFVHNGEIQKAAMEAGIEGSTTKRRILEMIEEGYLEAMYNDKKELLVRRV